MSRHLCSWLLVFGLMTTGFAAAHAGKKVTLGPRHSLTHFAPSIKVGLGMSVAPACSLGNVLDPVDEFDYIDPDFGPDSYYTLIDTDSCTACVPGSPIQIDQVHMSMTFPATCSQPVDITFVGVTGPASCPKADEAHVLAGPFHFELPGAPSPDPTQAQLFDLPLPTLITLPKQAFLGVTISDWGTCRVTLDGGATFVNPLLVYGDTTACIPCRDYNYFYDSGGINKYDYCITVNSPGSPFRLGPPIQYVTGTCIVPTRTLTVTTVGNGTVAKNPDRAVYDDGTPVELTATPDSAWHFIGWSGDTTAADNPLALTMTRDRALTATFVPSTFFGLAVTIVGSGVVTKDPDQPAYESGSPVTLTATPAAGWHFTGWSGDTATAATSLALTMTGDRSLTATFEINRYAIAVTQPPLGGSIDPPGGMVDDGAQPSFRMVPASAYRVAEVIVDGLPIAGAPGVYQFPPVHEDHAITARFEATSSALVRVFPSPSANGSSLLFRLAADVPIRAQILDLKGRNIRTLDRAGLGVGEHLIVWDGHDDLDQPTPPGLYFVRWRIGSRGGATRVLRVK